MNPALLDLSSFLSPAQSASLIHSITTTGFLIHGLPTTPNAATFVTSDMALPTSGSAGTPNESHADSAAGSLVSDADIAQVCPYPVTSAQTPMRFILYSVNSACARHANHCYFPWPAVFYISICQPWMQYPIYFQYCANTTFPHLGF